MDSEPTHEERLRTNYNDVGVAAMQAMYSDGYLSIGGLESTDELAALAKVGPSTHVLDIGCGVGGPALHLAESVGCSVTGIDLVETSIDHARRRAVERGLEAKATFEQADATSLPFPDDNFDVVLGQDAWCHIPDKTALLSEVARVLRSEGTIAFTDWLDGGGMAPAERQQALDAALSTTASSADGYLTLLASAGFVGSEYTDITPTFVEQYRGICAGLQANRSDLTTRFGERVYEIVVGINNTILGGFEGGAIGGGRYIARLSI